jgi:hypothetical protein
MPRDYVRGAKVTIRNEKARRQKIAPLLEAAGVLPEIPPVAVVAKQRQTAHESAGSMVAEINAKSRAAVERYRAWIRDTYGAKALARADAALKADKVLVKLGPEYQADFYCEQVAAIAGCSKLEAFNLVRGRAADAPPSYEAI